MECVGELNAIPAFEDIKVVLLEPMEAPLLIHVGTLQAKLQLVCNLPLWGST